MGEKQKLNGTKYLASMKEFATGTFYAFWCNDLKEFYISEEGALFVFTTPERAEYFKSEIFEPTSTPVRVPFSGNGLKNDFNGKISHLIVDCLGGKGFCERVAL